MEGSRIGAILRWTCSGTAGLFLYALVCGLRGQPYDLFVAQDRQVLPLVCAALLLISAWPVSHLSLRFSPRISWRSAAALCGLAVILMSIGTYVVMHDYAFTRDEQMAVFDSLIFRTGHLTAPVLPEWRQFALPLAPLYVLHFPQNAQWASAYLPGNAALRAAFSVVFNPAFLNPCLAGLGGLFLFAIARRLFPDSRSAQGVSLILYLTSAQIAAAAMTPFAMTAHLTFNLLWLLLFLRGRWAGHAGAGLTGFFATGLHQVVFHPLFVAPFMFQLLRQRRWSVLAFYVFVYAASGLFWISYQGLIGGSVVAPHVSGSSAAGSFLQDRVVPLLATRDPATLPLMIFNLLRFVSWQNLALIPLAIAGIGIARRGEQTAQGLYWGILLTIAAMFVLLPFQSFGWGYRYLHGLIGNVALLGGFGWRRLQQDARAHLLLAVGTVVTLAFSVPYLLFTTERLLQPSVTANAAINRLPADFAIIDTDDSDPARAQATNDPYLRNRPLRFASTYLSSEDALLLCSRGTIALLGRTDMEGYGLPYETQKPTSFKRAEQALRGQRCARSSIRP